MSSQRGNHPSTMNPVRYTLTTRAANRLAAGAPDIFLQAPAGPRVCPQIRLVVRFRGRAVMRRVCLPKGTPMDRARAARDVVVQAIAAGRIRCHLDWLQLRLALQETFRPMP